MSRYPFSGATVQSTGASSAWREGVARQAGYRQRQSTARTPAQKRLFATAPPRTVVLPPQPPTEEAR
jgi:hypothetical protein